ncbi:MAG: Crp/Fnr family transcriptional regulator [Bacteroidota bacterium]
MNSFLKKLSQFATLSAEESLLLEKQLQYKHLKKGDYLLSKGAVCSALHFVDTGSFYRYKTDAIGHQKVIDLYAIHDWVINHASFTARKPSEDAIQAYEDSTVYELTIDAIHLLIGQSPTFFQIGKVFEIATARINFFDEDNTPDEKYLFLLNHKPELIQKFPQKLIASYLKITPETLSRVRRRI